MKEYLIKEIENLVVQGYEKFYIYPFGNIGMEVKKILEERYGVDECIPIDNKLCNFNKKIISCRELAEKGKQWTSKDIVILASDNAVFYADIRLEIKKYVPAQNIKDLFPTSPLVSSRDVRIASMAIAAKEIYRKNISGSVAESGVYRGDFAKYINMIFPDRKLYLFDSFEGFDSNTVVESCDNREQVDKWIGTLKDTSIDIVMKKMTFPGNISIKKGFFPGSAEDVKDEFCFVNLDMDLYAPTYDGLNFFWDKLSKGGYIFIHDFYIWDGIEVAVNRFCKENNVGYTCLTDNCTAVIAKPI